MSGVNKVIIIGFLGSDPVERHCSVPKGLKLSFLLLS
ncbi:Uncharacterised protein [Haemophilus haemolyticus]|nr:Uncharacterised protein [Haemophilus haemolyticus]